MIKIIRNLFLKKEISKRALSAPAGRLQIVIQAALLLLIPLLAVMQFFWLGQLSDAEKARLKSNLQISAQKFSEDFDTELTKIHTMFRIKSESDKEFPGELSDTYNRWQMGASFPELIDEVYLMEYSKGGIEKLNLFDRDKGVFHRAVWPDNLKHIKQLLQENKNLPGAMLLPLTHAPQLENTPTIMVDCYTCLPSNDVHVNLEIKFNYLLIVLNEKILKNKFIPALMQSYFPENEYFEFDLAISAGSSPPKIFYMSDPDQPISRFAEADASAEIGKWRTNNFIFTSTAMIKTDITLKKIQMIKRNTNPSRISIKVIKDEAAGDEQFFNFLFTENSRWEVKIKYKAGSVDQLISSARNRNLFISYSILLILGISIVFMFISSARARALARKQVEFAANLSHDLRTPLAVIRSAGENIADGLISDESQIKKYGRLIRDEGRRLTNMVEQTLSFASVQASNNSFNFRTIKINDVIWESVHSVQNSINGNDTAITVKSDMDSNLVNGDASALKTAFVNLLGNAVKYSGNGQEIKINSSINQDRNTIVIEISDQGAGIPEAELPNIFVPFYRGKNNTDQTPGSGLGLSIVKNIIDAHGGKIFVINNKTGGCTFSAELPIAEINLRQKQ